MARPRVTARRAPSPWAALSPSASVVTAVSDPSLAAAVVTLAGPSPWGGPWGAPCCTGLGAGDWDPGEPSRYVADAPADG